jgi:uncharacterized membrane protein
VLLKWLQIVVSIASGYAKKTERRNQIDNVWTKFLVGDEKMKSIINKLLTFIIFTFFGGLLQLWVLFLVLVFLGKPPSAGALLGDGGLYFFSTSLALSSLASLWQKKPLKYDDTTTIISIGCVGITLLLAVVAYVSVLSSGLGRVTSPFSTTTHITSQLSCAVLASVYAMYVTRQIGLWED